MKPIVKAALKIIGLVLLLETINTFVFLGSVLLNSDLGQTIFVATQVLSFLIYLAASILFLVTPDWLMRPFGILTEESGLSISFDKETLRFGMAILGLYFIVDSGSSVVSFVVRSIVLLATHDYYLGKLTENELPRQISGICSLVAGLLLVFRNRAIAARIWRKERPTR